MNVNDKFSEFQYDEYYNFAIENNLDINEIEKKQEYIDVEKINEKGETVIEKELVWVRYFQIVEKPIHKPTNNEISQQRQNAYIERTDPLTLRKLRKQALGEWTTEDEKEYVAQIQAISAQIASDFPYNSEEPSLGA